MCKASHCRLWQQATIELRSPDKVTLLIACSLCVYNGLDVILRAHPVHGESHIQCNANGEVATPSSNVSRPGVPKLGYMYPQEYICLSEDVHLRLAIDEKNILHALYFQIFIHILVSVIFKNHYIVCLLLYIYIYIYE